MGIFKFLFYLILFSLIKIGDFVYSSISRITERSKSLLNEFGLLLSEVKKSSTYKSKKNNVKKQKRDSKTIRHYLSKVSNHFDRIVRPLGSVLKYTVKEAVGFTAFVFSVFLFPLKLIAGVFRRRKREREIVYRTSFFKKVKYFSVGAFISFFVFFLPALLYVFISDLPSVTTLSSNSIPKTTKIFDRNGTLLFEIYSAQNRTIVPLERIPKNLIQATISIEDQNFYEHPGFDLKGIARALYINFFEEDQLQGGSTITQQLIKSALLTPEPTIIRKTKEIVLAFWAEREYSKDEILEMYFNFIPYGGTAWGIEAASNVYFGKDVSSLTLAESAYLAGLPRAPSIYSPFITDGSQGKKRQKEVLNAMVREGYISRFDAEVAYQEKLSFLPPQVPIKAPHFVMYVKELLVRKYGLFEVERGGLHVTTSLDLNLQHMVEEKVAQEVVNGAHFGIGNGAALITDPENGDILAMVGSTDYFNTEKDGNVNLTTALRQPGSTIKLVTYALALEKGGYTEATVLEDTPLVITTDTEVYKPVNYDGRFHGRVPLRVAFANSYNIPAVRVAQKMGVREIVDFGKELGITSWGSPDNYGVSITLGGAEVTMTDLATVYGTIANNGEKISLDPFLEIKDSNGKLLLSKNPEGERVVSPAVAFILSDILADNRTRSLAFGPNSPLNIPGYKVSVKTGTTDNKRDNWTIGFTDDYVVATWVGNNDNTPLSPALSSGITGAAPIWNSIMTTLLKDSIQDAEIIPESLVKRNCFGYDAYFVRGTDEGARCRIVNPSPTFQQQ